MIRMCQCGLATDDVRFLRHHQAGSGHRERVAWWLPVPGRGARPDSTATQVEGNHRGRPRPRPGTS
jgi:hypothetical protein